MLVDGSKEDKAALLALGRRVRTLRENKGMTQEAFARRCQISVSFTSLLERGERSPSYETLLTIARALEVSVATLFREGNAIEVQDPAHARVLDFVRRAQLSRQQIDRYISVGRAMFGVEPSDGDEAAGSLRCSFEECQKPILARGLCASHYHRDRRAKRNSP
jgi:transcriptional regulator with XRE-family HTH domain